MNALFIVGPTAVGKSALALTVARCCGGVICAMDAFQVYRRLDIGTGKPTVGEQAAAPHRLINLCDPLDRFSVADYLREAERALTVIPAGTPRIWTGGTGLYARALRLGLGAAPASDPELARQLDALPLTVLQEEIRRLDPAWCATADLQNPRRIIRALAVARGTGKPFSEWQRERGKPLLAKANGIFLLPKREEGRSRIAARVRQMWAAGWPDEVQSLLTVSGWRESQSARALGYLTIADYLDGRLGRSECLEKIITQTGQYAKRQVTWFRKEPGFAVAADGDEALRLAEQWLREGRLPES
ncbi:MAG: tRNA (adenosine(37)-N6)-dimethylallyltransferase MiaA [Verrucomicrobiales bacterium]|nr:tRNA (adenosine(37)-N6)-dimethylallyltransferase MiaA [Verrucomicrobiales bacterium]